MHNIQLVLLYTSRYSQTHHLPISSTHPGIPGKDPASATLDDFICFLLWFTKTTTLCSVDYLYMMRERKKQLTCRPAAQHLPFRRNAAKLASTGYTKSVSCSLVTSGRPDDAAETLGGVHGGLGNGATGGQ